MTSKGIAYPVEGKKCNALALSNPTILVRNVTTGRGN
jgi:hypothetical protein